MLLGLLYTEDYHWLPCPLGNLVPLVGTCPVLSLPLVFGSASPFCLPLSVLPRGWSLASEPWSIGRSPILCPSSLILLGCLSASFLEQFLLLLLSCSWFSLLVGKFMAHHVDRCAPFCHPIPCCLPPWMTLGWLLPTPVDVGPCLLSWILSWVCAQLSPILPHSCESFKFQAGPLYMSSILL